MIGQSGLSDMDSLEVISVECYSGYKVNETPRAFTFRGRRYKIIEVIDRWYEDGIKSNLPQLDYFRVKADDKQEYILRYNSLYDKWAILVK